MKKRICMALTALILLSLALASCGKKEVPKFYLAETVSTIHATGQVFRVVNIFDEDWNVIEAVNYTGGEEVSRTLYETKGDVTRITMVQGGESELVELVTTDQTTHTVHSEVYLNGEVSNTVDNTYDEDDHLLTTVRWTAAQDITARSEYTNNAAGKKVREDIYNDGVLSRYIVYTYDEAGRVLSQTTCQSDGTETGWQQYTYEQRENGRLVQTAHRCAADGSPLALQAVCVYDEHENLLSQEIYLDDGTPYMTLALRYITSDGGVSSGIPE